MAVKMGQDMDYIRVGIKTDGDPAMKPDGNGTRLSNMLIGDGFHWERTIEVLLPGDVAILDSTPGMRGEADEKVTVINSLPIETYLECVVGSEMNPASPIEFLKAHAVVSRSWALGKVLGSHKYSGKKIDEPHRLVGWDDDSDHRGFHVCSDDHCQRYQGVQPVSQQALRAIRETAGEVILTPDGNIVDARFSKCCGGRTEKFSTCWQPIEARCIESFDDPWCDLSELKESDRTELLSTILKDYDRKTPGYGYSWKAEISKVEVGANLMRQFGRTVGKVERLEPLHRGASGRIDLLRIHGSESWLDLGKELWIRRVLSPSHLYSSAFDIEDTGNGFVLTGKGWGHGAGLCQIGAANMAAHGHDYRSILSFYYPGSVVAKGKTNGGRE